MNASWREKLTSFGLVQKDGSFVCDCCHEGGQGRRWLSDQIANFAGRAGAQAPANVCTSIQSGDRRQVAQASKTPPSGVA